MRKATLLVGLAAGYVLGTRDGRERYEKIKSQAIRVWQDPRVQEKASQAAQKVSSQIGGTKGKSKKSKKKSKKSKKSDSSKASARQPTSAPVLPTSAADGQHAGVGSR